MGIQVTRDTRLLFIGDSITDCGRGGDVEGLGSGYVRLVRDYLLARDPGAAPVVLNRGISGNKIPDLQGRWDKDVLALSPDVVSVMIGINDVWHGLNPEWRPGCEIGAFTTGYREILTKLRAARPGCRVVLCEPTVIWPPAPAEGNECLRPYVRAVHELAREFSDQPVVRLHEAFVEAKRKRADVDWATDGVHPTSAGHMLIARTWLATVGLL